MDVMDNVSFNDQAVISVMEIVRMSTRKIKKKTLCMLRDN